MARVLGPGAKGEIDEPAPKKTPPPAAVKVETPDEPDQVSADVVASRQKRKERTDG